MRRTGHVAGIAATAFGVVALLMAALPARAEVHLDITRGKVEPLPIAIPDFAGGGGEESQTGSQIAGVVSADLDRSGLFRPLDPKSFIQNVSLRRTEVGCHRHRCAVGIPRARRQVSGDGEAVHHRQELLDPGFGIAEAEPNADRALAREGTALPVNLLPGV